MESLDLGLGEEDPAVGSSAVLTHRLLFLFFLGSLLAALGLGLLESRAPRWSIQRLPSVCALKNTTGLDCPGCGLTRSWVALGRFDLGASLRFHALGWLIMLYVTLQALRHGLWLNRPSLRSRMDRWGYSLDRSAIVLGGVLFLNWIRVLWS